jgi:hypothetical protein
LKENAKGNLVKNGFCFFSKTNLFLTILLHQSFWIPCAGQSPLRDDPLCGTIPSAGQSGFSGRGNPSKIISKTFLKTTTPTYHPKMNAQPQPLNTAQFHRKIKAYITHEIDNLLEQTIRTDRLLLEDEPPESLHQSEIVNWKMQKVISTFYTNQENILKWFLEIERSLHRPSLRVELPITYLGFEGFRINRSIIRCESLKPSTVKKLLDNAKDYAIRKEIPDKVKFTTADVLSFYFTQYTRMHMDEFKLECATKLKEIHREILERLPLDPVRLDEMDYLELFRASESWLDESGARRFNTEMTNTCSSSHLHPFSDAANPTKHFSMFDDCEVDF